MSRAGAARLLALALAALAPGCVCVREVEDPGEPWVQRGAYGWAEDRCHCVTAFDVIRAAEGNEE